MSRTLRIVLLLAGVVAQLTVPALMIRQYEDVLRNGDVFRFRTAPVDPYDAFRGRFVAVRIESNSVPAVDHVEFPRGTKTFIEIGEDDAGYAHFAGLAAARPKENAYLLGRVTHTWEGRTHLDVPVDRFYMAEADAPLAERAYWRNSLMTNHTASILLRVKDGKGVIEDVLIGDTPISQFVEENRESLEKNAR